MTTYYEVVLPLNKSVEEVADMVSAWIIDYGFEGIVESESELTAYISQDLFDPIAWDQLLNHLFSMNWLRSIEVQPVAVENQNWNQIWEQYYFKPIAINNEVYVRGSFHSPEHGCKYEIVIDPKMAFGTGHHQTTQMMLQAMTGIHFPGTWVLDMGTGTGILAIYAALKGAECIHAVDIDDNAVENAQEHITLNKAASAVAVFKGDEKFLKDKVGVYDTVLANINLGVLLCDMDLYLRALKPGGHLLLSGFLTSDKEAICSLFQSPPILEQSLGDWMLLGFKA